MNNNSSNDKGKSRFLIMANMLIVLFVMISGGIASFLLPNPTVSEVEKRELAKAPVFSAKELFGGTYTRAVEAFYADTFPAREKLIQLAFLIDDLKGISLSGGQIYDPVQNPPQPSQESGSQPESSPEKSSGSQDSSSKQPEAPAGDGYTSQGVFVCDDRAFSLFGQNKAMEKYYANTINNYAAVNKGVQVYNLLVPTSGEFYIPQKYSNLWRSELNSINSIYGQLSPEVKPVDAYSELAAHKDEYLYFRTDHHWTVRGAYYAYTAFARAAGFEPLPLTSFEAKELHGKFLGTQYSLTMDKKLSDNPDKLEYFIVPMQYQAYLYQKDQPFAPYKMKSIWAEYAKGVNSYSLFLAGDLPLIRIDTKAGTGRKVLMVKESFGNAFAPFLISHFDQVFIADQRYFQTSLNELIKQNGITDLLFINNIFAANTQYHVNCIRSLGNQVWTPPEPSEESEEASEASESSNEQ